MHLLDDVDCMARVLVVDCRRHDLPELSLVEPGPKGRGVLEVLEEVAPWDPPIVVDDALARWVLEGVVGLLLGLPHDEVLLVVLPTLDGIPVLDPGGLPILAKEEEVVHSLPLVLREVRDIRIALCIGCHSDILGL